MTQVQTPTRYIAVANQKGGVGKTTTAINLATAMSAVGKSVLLVDLDPQGNATTGLNIKRKSVDLSVYDMILGEAQVQDLIRNSRVPRLDVIPSSVHLSGAEIELVNVTSRESRLRTALRGKEKGYDYVIVDCPPSLNLLTLNALVACDSVVVPLQCEFYALEGLSHLTKTIDRVREHFNPELALSGVVLTMYDQRNNLSGMVAGDVRAHFGDKVYKTVIPRNVRLSEAPSYGLPAIVYDMRCAGAKAYIALAREILQREGVLEDKAPAVA